MMEDDHASPGEPRGEHYRTAPRLADSQFYRALASARRRRLLFTLLDEGECTVEEAATVLTGWEATDSSGTGRPDDGEQVALALEHVHLPLLTDAGLVTFDREAGVVSLEPVEPPVSELIRLSVESAGKHSE